MKALTHVFIIVSICLFFYPSHMHGMDNEKQTETADLFSLIELPNEILGHIACQSFDYDTKYQVMKLMQGIEFCVQLSALCKKLYTSLTPEGIGTVFKYYDQDIKNRGLLVTALDYQKSRRLNVLAFMYAGADVTHKDACLLERAVIVNDVQCAEILFKHKADPITKIEIDGPFYRKRSSRVGKLVGVKVKTTKMAQVFIDYGYPAEEFSVKRYKTFEVLNKRDEESL